MSISNNQLVPRITIRKDDEAEYILLEPFLLRKCQDAYEAAYIPFSPNNFNYKFTPDSLDEIYLPKIVECGNFNRAKTRILPILSKSFFDIDDGLVEEVVSIKLLELSEGEMAIKTLSSHYVEDVIYADNIVHAEKQITIDHFVANLTHCAFTLTGKKNSHKKYICLLSFENPEVMKFSLKMMLTTGRPNVSMQHGRMENMYLVNNTVFYEWYYFKLDGSKDREDQASHYVYRVDFINQDQTVIFAPMEYCQLSAISPPLQTFKSTNLVGHRLYVVLEYTAPDAVTN